MTELPEGLAGRDPEEVLAFLREATDDELTAEVHALGTPVVLTLLFDAWAARVPAARRSAGLLVVELDDDGTTYRHGLELSDAGAVHRPDPSGGRASLRTSVVRFLRVAAGAQDPKRLVLTGRLRLGGDVVWAVTTLSGMQAR